ncbi:hypothetical protein C2845_PM10G12340 [Panicum miliaceum]|uniref:Uncharacterized protein n=1 Tax=Panicum miliaceum TaxID=4540 RepID=A0A3L6PH41_PANMI|nr:hypothetical protein C2845_PM10G12340 [Panicum miliaceum]
MSLPQLSFEVMSPRAHPSLRVEEREILPTTQLKPVQPASSTRRLSTLHRVIFIHHALHLAAARYVEEERPRC